SRRPAPRVREAIMIEPIDPVHAATEMLATASVDVPAPSGSARADAIATVARAIALRVARRRRRRMFFVAAVAAAAVALVVGVASRRHTVAPTNATTNATVTARVDGVVKVRHAGGVDESLLDGGALGSGDRVDVPAASHADLAFSTGTKIALDAESDFEIVATGAQQVFALD